ncbi:MAG TPA: tRNA lysidine(34) synthetase TilS [Chthoniobacterales bacterium]|jgi:tRNA(Ile)-lysidine synthase|nr:tRNA lysidine(34) synthetase TilS [Chthoniobacterales bacterium]
MNWIQTNKNFQLPPDGRYLVGVSGGRDSIALLHWLVKSGYKKLTACHLNHQLRGSSSGRDAKFVEKMAAKLDVDLEIGSADVRALAAKQKMSIEAAGRDARYKFFAEVAKKKRAPTIFLGHHADDLVETFFINLFRGSGTSGLGSMREISKRRIDDVDLTIVRPFLGIWRREIDEYIAAHGLKFREDESNKDLAVLRNRVRRRIIPYLEKTLGRNIRQNIFRAAMIAAEEEHWLEDQLPNANDVDLSVARLRELPVALQRRQILRWLRGQKISNVGFDVVEGVRSLIDPETRIAKVNLPQDRHARRRAGKIFIE